MLSPLNGWQRIGTVLAMLWLLFIFGAGFSEYINLATGNGPFIETISGPVVVLKKGTEGHCTQTDPDPEPAPDGSYTWDQVFAMGRHCAQSQFINGAPDVTRRMPDRHVFHFDALLLAAFVPPALLWALISIAVAVMRWIAAGFRPK